MKIKSMTRALMTLLILLSAGEFLRSQESTNSLGMTMVTIPAGRFKMGQEKLNKDYKSRLNAEIDQSGDWDEVPAREVEMTEPFEISATEVTNAQYEAFAAGHRAGAKTSKKISQEDDAAVVNVSWDDAMSFCAWLSEKEKTHYRLPTEAEWEYACRAGTGTIFHYGDALPDKFQPMLQEFNPPMGLYIDAKTSLAYYDFVDSISLLPKRHAPNAFGLYDMHGNVQEWCIDWYGAYDPANLKNPVGTEGNTRVVRGGAFSCYARILRSANRSSMVPIFKNELTGFRVVRAMSLGEVGKSSAPPLFTEAKPVPPPANPLYDPAKPAFEGPIGFVDIPQGSAGPVFSAHNHGPSVACMPNGDIFVAWFTTVMENGTEVAVACSRLRAGEKKWSPAEMFFDAADMNDPVPALLVDGDTVYHINKSGGGDFIRTSKDSGKTWLPFKLLCPQLRGNLVNIAALKTRDGRLLATVDGPRETCMVIESSDHGNNWKLLSAPGIADHDAPGGTGKAIAGIHAGLVELNDGRLLALGRMDNIKRTTAYNFKLPMSVSSDGGKTWSYSASEFGVVTAGQRITMRRLREGPILLCAFTDRLLAEKAEENANVGLNVTKSKVRPESERDGMMVSDGKGGQKKGFGLFAALSWDDGKTWPVRRLLVPEEGVSEGGANGLTQKINSTFAEASGYLSVDQALDGKIHLVSSRNYYAFNYPWLVQGTGFEKAGSPAGGGN